MELPTVARRSAATHLLAHGPAPEAALGAGAHGAACAATARVSLPGGVAKGSNGVVNGQLAMGQY